MENNPNVLTEREFDQAANEQISNNLTERFEQLKTIVSLREKIMVAIENENGFDSFKQNTAEIRGELKALALIAQGVIKVNIPTGPSQVTPPAPPLQGESV